MLKFQLILVVSFCLSGFAVGQGCEDAIEVLLNYMADTEVDPNDLMEEVNACFDDCDGNPGDLQPEPSETAECLNSAVGVLQGKCEAETGIYFPLFKFPDRRFGGGG